MGELTPFDAFTASLQADGSVIAVADLYDPVLKPIAVVEFGYCGEEYLGFYHDELDRWELFGPNDFYRLTAPDDSFYHLCEQTVRRWIHKLGAAGDGTGRLTREMARTIMTEIDNDIITNLRCVNTSPLPPISIPQLTIGKPLRPVKPTWSLDSDEDLRSELGRHLIGKSRIKPEVV